MKNGMLFIVTCALAGASWGCKAPVDYTAALMANEWQLKELVNDTDTVVLPARVPTLVFADSGRVSGFSGCNRFTGKYTVKGETITFSRVVTTHMMCVESMAFEQLFQRLLPGLAHVAVRAGELTLSDEKGKARLLFVPAPPRRSSLPAT
ncbi:MAG: META domain-containing protein [Odoribacteraceae bacterium]|jgi:heat shock protein HslJ|nr:META domain-containing protein [Odoribacteraceae bacterium]